MQRWKSQAWQLSSTRWESLEPAKQRNKLLTFLIKIVKQREIIIFNTRQYIISKIISYLWHHKIMKGWQQKTRQKTPKGYAYILTKPSFKEGWTKIGKSSHPVNARSKGISKDPHVASTMALLLVWSIFHIKDTATDCHHLEKKRKDFNPILKEV